MMELFFTPELNDRGEYYEGIDDKLHNACKWVGVTCSADDHVLEIMWAGWELRVSGRIDFSKAPQKTESIDFAEQNLYGEVHTSALPSSLQRLYLMDCAFSGSLDMRSLPPKLRQFVVTGNNITAMSAIRNLPESLRDVTIGEAGIVIKSIRIEKLHSSLVYIDISECGFTEVIFEDENDAKKVSAAI